MLVKVYLRSPPDVMTPDLSPRVQGALPNLELPDGSTVETLLRIIGVRKARPLVLINKVRQKEDTILHPGDRVDLVLPIAGG